MLESSSSSGLKEGDEEASSPSLVSLATPRDCSRRWSLRDGARFDAWTSNVLPRARAAIERAFDREAEEGEGEHSLLKRLPLPLPLPLPLEVNGIADLPLSTLRAGLLPAGLNARAEEEDKGFGLEAISDKLGEWLRFPYATEALEDAAALAADAAEAPNENDDVDDGVFNQKSKRHRHRHRPLPASIDWTTENVLGPVKNQHVNGTPCGCCWSFACTGTVEGAVGVASGKKPPSLSEEQLINCDRGPPFDDLGCQGGSGEGEGGERSRRERGGGG